MGVVLAISNTSHIEHAARCFERHGVMVLVVLIDNLDDAGLYNHLGAFVTRKHSCVNGAAFYFGTVFVKNCVLFSMADIRVFCVKGIFSLTCPR